MFGVFAPGEDVSRLIYFGLHALQHRGQESAGIAVGDGESVTVKKDVGLVTQVFNESDLATLTGFVGVGHTRLATGDAGDLWEAAQPHLGWIGDETIALAHNGALINGRQIRKKLMNLDIGLRSTTDSEAAAKLIGHYTQQTHVLREGITRAMEDFQGAYSMMLITPKALYAFRDPSGIRPLSLGELPDGAGYVIASETCAFDIVGATFVRDIEPGEIVKVGPEGVVNRQGLPPAERPALCIFEHVYLARPDSIMDGAAIYDARAEMGRRLAREAPADADMVIGVPDSGIPGAVGFAAESGIPFAEGIIKNRYIGRTFIESTQFKRQMGIYLKLNPLRSTIQGQRLVVVDDSVVRGNTSKQIVEMLRAAGAAEVHLRVVSPPTVWPCFYGVDTSTQDQLIAATHDLDEIREFTGADSIAFISLEGLVESVRSDDPSFCCACFDGVYPVDIPEYAASEAFIDGHGGRG